MAPNPALVKHSEEFRKELFELAPGVFTAVGYGASNAHMLVGEEGNVVIDTTDSTKAAENILALFKEKSKAPIETIIYTHSHRDHISGATVMSGGRDIEIMAHAKFSSDIVNIDESRPAPNAAIMARTKRQFGIGLSFPDERVNMGLGPGDRPTEGIGAGHIPPNKRISEDRVTISRCGLDLDLVHAPGETPDHMMVWLKDQEILFCADNFYPIFPNLYAIRGTPYRDFDAWADSLDVMIDLEPAILVSGHGRPIFGKEEIRATLEDYRDAIRYIIAEAAAGMNAGKGLEELAGEIKLPDHLASKSFLQEFYGKVSWSVKAYVVGTLGWFDGNPTNLNRLPPKEEAAKSVKLAGGADKVLTSAQEALAEDDSQWAMELADRLIVLGDFVPAATGVKLAAMRKMADLEINATARNYYLLYAKELEAGT